VNRLLIRACLVAIANILATTVDAQSSTRVLPESLVNALIGGLHQMGPGNPPEYFVGALPPGYPAMLVPDGPVTVLGGARSGNQLVVVLADSTRRLSTVMEDLLQASGYSRPGATPGSGFSSAPGPNRDFCKDSATVSVEPVMGEMHEMARVTYRRNRGQSCSWFGPPPSRGGVLKLPPLKPLANAHVSTSGGGSGEQAVDSHARVDGQALDPSVLLAHYVAQLVQAGWKTGAPAIGAHVAAQFLEAVDDTGKHWQGTIMVSGSSTAMDLALIMRAR
jgi:hypothetical protein